MAKNSPQTQLEQHLEMQKIPNPLFRGGSVSSTGSDKLEHLNDKIDAAVTQVHVQALDEVVAVNSFFTVAVFIGLSFTNPANTQTSLVDSCQVGANFTKFLLVFEVIAFSSYLLSSLIAQGLKLLIILVNSKNHPDAFSAQVNPRFLRFGMLVTAIGTLAGTVFLTLSIVILIQIRLGLLNCDNAWSKWAAIPMVVMVATGLLTFISTALYAFIH